VLRLLFASPRRAAILVALLVTLLLGYFSLNLEETVQREFTGAGASELAAIGDAEELARRFGQAGPWWSPQRYLYRAIAAEVDGARDVLVLTFERDSDALLLLLLGDIFLGGLYGLVVGMIVAVLRGHGPGSTSPKPPRPIPPPPPLRPRSPSRDTSRACPSNLTLYVTGENASIAP
jgi:hypothetical protein